MKMAPGLSWLSNIAKVGYSRIRPLFQNMEPYPSFFKMVVSVYQNGHFEEMEAWLQILQIVGNSNAYPRISTTILYLIQILRFVFFLLLVMYSLSSLTVTDLL